VEDPEKIASCWPSSRWGSTLITSRLEIVAHYPANNGYRMLSFSKEEGTDFLLKLLHRGQYTEDEIQSAGDFTEELDGLPLALHLVGTKMLTMGKSIRKSVDQYKKDPATIHRNKNESMSRNLYYPKTLERVWKEVFGSLSDEENSADVLAIMGVFSFMAADEIPEEIFRPTEPETLPPSLRFCEDEDKLSLHQ
jgi:hypothetical protein